MKKIIYSIIFCVVLTFTSYTYGQTIDKNNLEVKIDALIPKQVNDSTPGLVVGIVQKGELIFSKGYGLANMSYGIPNSPKMVYNIGSVSKQFLGYAFAMLHAKGDLNIDDSVNKYLKDFPKFKHNVTLRHLLTHTSGYREAYTMSVLAGRIIGVDHLSKEECLEVVKRQPELEFVPGSRWVYNSTAWVILAEVLEKVTAQPADKWVENNILRPLKMYDTQIESYVGEVIKNSAESYTKHGDKEYSNKNSNRAIFGAADVYTSVYDLVKWINNYRTAEIGGKAVNELFLAPFILNDGTNSEYALGIRNNSYRGLRRYEHSGSHEAFLTQLSYFPDYDLGIITISNFGNNGLIHSEEIAELFLKEYMTTQTNKENQQEENNNKIKKWTPNQEDLISFKGDYWSDEIETVYHVKIVDKNLTMQRRWLGEIRLEPIKQDLFKTNLGYNVNFIRNKKGVILGLYIQSNRTSNIFFQRKE
ncbi:MAG: hypothetical protein CR994_09650 [Maribacter sp.]|nr:MAG: hypothetical protein CR994_09650 [Maribacter sp.]